jgi:hypothetical protein
MICRNEIQDHTGQPLDDKYFTQTLLPDFVNDRPDLTAGWDVVFDARGHFLEPHTGLEVPLGTLDVRQYVRGDASDSPVKVRGLFPTHGHANRFGAVLFIEKEGFLPLLHRVHLAQRYDLAIMSTKGMSVVAARALVDHLCGRNGVPLLVAHDFDKAGFSILATLTRSNRRYRFASHVRPIDLGLRLADVAGLEDEDSFLTGDGVKHRNTLRRNGAHEPARAGTPGRQGRRQTPGVAAAALGPGAGRNCKKRDHPHGRLSKVKDAPARAGDKR